MCDERRALRLPRRPSPALAALSRVGDTPKQELAQYCWSWLSGLQRDRGSDSCSSAGRIIQEQAHGRRRPLVDRFQGRQVQPIGDREKKKLPVDIPPCSNAKSHRISRAAKFAAVAKTKLPRVGPDKAILLPWMSSEPPLMQEHS